MDKIQKFQNQVALIKVAVATLLVTRPVTIGKTVTGNRTAPVTALTAKKSQLLLYSIFMINLV